MALCSVCDNISTGVSVSEHFLLLLSEHDEFFHGRVFGEMKSHAHVHIENGVLTASIHLEHDIYHIEVNITGRT